MIIEFDTNYYNIKRKIKILMKFNSSQRTLHKKDYNPPCNVYNTSEDGYEVKTGSLAGACFVKRNTFGYEGRFQKIDHGGPGPGAYHENNASLPKTKNNLIKGKYYAPSNASSIPYTYFGQNPNDQEQKEYIKQQHLKEDIMKGVKLIKNKQAAYSFAKSEKIVGKKAEKEKPTLEKEIFQHFQEEREVETRKSSSQWRQRIKKTNDRRREIINQIGADFVPSLELIEMIKKRRTMMIPGPAHYHTNESLPSMTELQKGANFTSTVRFKPEIESELGPGTYDTNSNNPSKNFSFCREKRSMFQPLDQGNYRFYIDPEKNIINNRSNSVGAFGSTETRFKALQKQPQISQKTDKSKTQKLKKLIKAKLSCSKKQTQSSEEDGLLRLSTMASSLG